MIAFSSQAQQTLPLYSGEIPNSKNHPDEEKQDINGILRISKISRPTLSVFLPDPAKANGTAIVICPGGGYAINAYGHEGTDIAKKFTEMGIAAFVLKYRIPDDKTMVNKEIGPLQDVQQAIQFVRSHAAEYKIKSNRIGVMGFSAGGHLASTAATHYENPVIKTSADVKPDFQILIYPVISFSPEYGHLGSRDNLLGKNADPEKVRLYSNDLRVTSKTPPAFIVHASDDNVVPVQNAIAYYESLIREKVDAELHVYQEGGHGFGLNNKTTDDQWMDRCKNWLKANGWL